MKSEYSKLFNLLDGYAKRHHGCFLTELFLSPEGDEYIMCFRPVISRWSPLDPIACEYVRIGIGETKEMVRVGLLTISIANILEEKLQPLGLMKQGSGN